MQFPPPGVPDFHPPNESHQYLLDMMRAALPAPDVDTPEAFAERDRRAMAEIAALGPQGLSELMIATTSVVAGATALDCLRLALVHLNDVKLFRQLSRQSKSMQRESRAQRAMLLRLQTARTKQQARAVPRVTTSRRRSPKRSDDRTAP
jgi:hypothetical protein